MSRSAFPGPGRRLSFPLDLHTPAYGGAQGLEVEHLTSIQAGDTANTVRVRFPNHLGTHVDAPAHFFDEGATLSDYAPEDWVFTRPVLADAAVESGELVSQRHVESQVPSDTDLLLIRTGHGQARGTDAYWQEGPGLSDELGFWLRTERPSVRAVGMDLISVTTRLARPEGKAAHRAFLDPAGSGSPIRLIEDMDLATCPKTLGWIVVSPLDLRNGDGGPVTVWAFDQQREET